MDRASAEMELRVVVVTTRAALRHARDDPAQHRAILSRGRTLVESIAARLGSGEAEAIDQAFAELDSLAGDGPPAPSP